MFIVLSASVVGDKMWCIFELDKPTKTSHKHSWMWWNCAPVRVHVLPSAGLSPRAAEIMERVGLLCTERR